MIKRTDDGDISFVMTEFEARKAYNDFKKALKKVKDGRFSNADAIRGLEDGYQLALRLWNLPKFDKMEDLYRWLQKEHVR